MSAKPSVFDQTEAIQVKGKGLLESPRHWNPGLFRFGKQLWMSYRYHRPTDDARCGLAMVQLNEKTLQPVGKSQALKFPADIDGFHHEDARLFTFKGDPYISYTEMSGYKPGVNYNCVVKYSKLALKDGRWKVLKTWQPKYGQNYGRSKEKNWIFFEQDRRLYCIYQGSPNHVVIEVDGENIVNEYSQPAPKWPWGEVRGGSPPVAWGEQWLHVFHSSLPTETPPHYVRYYAGAYTFDMKPPFTPRWISNRPMLAGSELDGHRVDPRFTEGWKPYVVFPCGVVESKDKESLLVAIGMNDWANVVCKISKATLKDGLISASDTPPARHFKTTNGSRPVRVLVITGQVRYEYMQWEVPRQGQGCAAGAGFLKIWDPRIAEDIGTTEGVEEISAAQYTSAVGHR